MRGGQAWLQHVRIGEQSQHGSGVQCQTVGWVKYREHVTSATHIGDVQCVHLLLVQALTQTRHRAVNAARIQGFTGPAPRRQPGQQTGTWNHTPQAVHKLCKSEAKTSVSTTER